MVYIMTLRAVVRSATAAATNVTRTVVRTVPRFVRRNAAWLVALAALVIAAYWLFGRREPWEALKEAAAAGPSGGSDKCQGYDDRNTKGGYRDICETCASGASWENILDNDRFKESRRSDRGKARQACRDGKASRKVKKDEVKKAKTSGQKCENPPGRCMNRYLKSVRPCAHKHSKKRCCGYDNKDCVHEQDVDAGREGAAAKQKKKADCKAPNTWTDGECVAGPMQSDTSLQSSPVNQGSSTATTNVQPQPQPQPQPVQQPTEEQKCNAREQTRWRWNGTKCVFIGGTEKYNTKEKCEATGWSYWTGTTCALGKPPQQPQPPPPPPQSNETWECEPGHSPDPKDSRYCCMDRDITRCGLARQKVDKSKYVYAIHKNKSAQKYYVGQYISNVGSDWNDNIDTLQIEPGVKVDLWSGTHKSGEHHWVAAGPGQTVKVSVKDRGVSSLQVSLNDKTYTTMSEKLRIT